MRDIMNWSGWQHARIGTIIASLVVLVIAASVITAVSTATSRLMPRAQARFQLPPDTVPLASRILSTVLWACAGLIILDLWGLSVSGLWTALISVMTLIGVGFLATWTMVSNVTANLFLTVWRPFHRGQSVSLLPEDLGGRVVDRTMMFTVLREEGGATLVIPNNLFVQKPFRVGENSMTQGNDAALAQHPEPGTVPGDTVGDKASSGSTR